MLAEFADNLSQVTVRQLIRINAIYLEGIERGDKRHQLSDSPLEDGHHYRKAKSQAGYSDPAADIFDIFTSFYNDTLMPIQPLLKDN